MTHVLYFAYGSNMLRERLTERCSRACYRGVAAATGYRLCFAKRGRDLSGKATLTRCDDPAAIVYGVAFTLDAADIAALDRHEGRGQGYDRADHFAIQLLDGGGLASATTYLAPETYCDASLAPFDWYKALVIAGALQSRFVPDYVDRIRQVAHQRDPDVARRDRHGAILRRANFADWQSLLTS